MAATGATSSPLGQQIQRQVSSALRGQITTGNIFYVSSGATYASDSTASSVGTFGRGRSPSYPFATLDYAIGQCTASNGDVIIVMPGHAESLSTAGFITCDVAGITIIGAGNGANRPTFSWSATDATWVISAANVVIRNIITKVSIDEVVSMFSVSGPQLVLDNVDFFPASTSLQAIQWLLTTSAANYLTIKNCYHRQLIAAASAQVWIQLVAGTGAKIVDNDIDVLANASASSICINGSTAVVSAEIARNYITWRGASITSPISFVTTSTGFIADNRIGMTSTSGTIDNIITGDTMFKFNNLVMDVAGTASGLLVPAVGTLT